MPDLVATRLRPALVDHRTPLLIEDYLVRAVNALNRPVAAEALMAERGDDIAANRSRLRDRTDSALSVRPDPVMAAGFPARTDIDQHALGGRAVCLFVSWTSEASLEGSPYDWDNAQPAATDVRLTRP